MWWKYAIHSISWGHCDLDKMLTDIKTAGYSGVELFQRPEELGGVAKIVQAFEKLDLKLIGVCSGSFDERCQFVRDLARVRNIPIDDASLPYVYTDEWRESDPKFKAAVAEGLSIALHPHMFKPVQTWQEAAEILKANPKLRFLPDTAHLKIAGEQPEEVIQEFLHKIDAIHLKDWQEDVGRSFHFYARGFCELGEGDVELEAVLNSLLRRGYSRWLVVEQGSTGHPLESAKRSVAWLYSRVGMRK